MLDPKKSGQMTVDGSGSSKKPDNMSNMNTWHKTQTAKSKKGKRSS